MRNAILVAFRPRPKRPVSQALDLKLPKLGDILPPSDGPLTAPNGLGKLHLSAKVADGFILGHAPLSACQYGRVNGSADIRDKFPGGAALPIGDMSTIGSRVRALRKKRGLTQVQLAREVGISQGSLSLIETDATQVPAGETLAALCKVLRTTPDFLIAGAGDPDSIDAAIQEHELVHLWRALPEAGRQMVIDAAKSAQRAFSPAPTPTPRT